VSLYRRKYQRFLDPLYYGDYPLVMKENTGSKLPKFSQSQSKQLINSMDFLGINYYTFLYVKDDPHHAPSNKRNFRADMAAKSIFSSNSTSGVRQTCSKSVLINIKCIITKG
uniref:Uncharacterized protein n=1 Tax=Aegilops tauschii subsp. strangulata TaxID=200361 RepID=A0A453EMN1_AEGTS